MTRTGARQAVAVYIPMPEPAGPVAAERAGARESRHRPALASRITKHLGRALGDVPLLSLLLRVTIPEPATAAHPPSYRRAKQALPLRGEQVCTSTWSPPFLLAPPRSSPASARRRTRCRFGRWAPDEPVSARRCGIGARQAARHRARLAGSRPPGAGLARPWAVAEARSFGGQARRPVPEVPSPRTGRRFVATWLEPLLSAHTWQPAGG